MGKFFSFAIFRSGERAATFGVVFTLCLAECCNLPLRLLFSEKTFAILLSWNIPNDPKTVGELNKFYGLISSPLGTLS